MHSHFFRLSIVLLGFYAVGLFSGTTRAQSLSVDITKREQSRVLYQTVYAASQGVTSGWTGSVTSNAAGTTSQAFRDATALRVNYFRAMAGVPAAVTLSDDLNAKCQQAALMMSANNALSHSPPTTWLGYTAAGAEAASRSNISWGSDGPAAIDGYIADTGDTNTAVGHRRWVLFPPTTVMGTGDVDSDSSHGAANALWVIQNGAGPTAAVAMRDGFVAWPPPGFVPAPLAFARWSLSYPGADFSAAKVTMQQNGQPVAVSPLALSSGVGDNTLVWVPANLATDTSHGDVACQVTVANVKGPDGSARTFSYTVTIFDPTQTGADTVLPSLTGSAQATAGAASHYTFNTVPGATGYQWTVRNVSAATPKLDAENGVGDATVSPASWNPVVSTDDQTGSACYQLNGALSDGTPGGSIGDDASGETLMLNATLLPAAGATLQFSSRLGFHVADEQALVQISTDDGKHWTNVYQQTGQSDPEATFTPRSVDLSAYAGQACRVRFAFTIPKVGSYLPRSPISGWFVDNVAFKGTQTLGAATATRITDGSLGFDWTPAADGAYLLQVTPLFFGVYPADAGPALGVQAGAGTGPTGSATVTLTANVPSVTAGSGGSASFLVTRSGDLSRDLLVLYTAKGSAKGGTDYASLSGKQKIKAGKSSAKINVVPLTEGGGSGKRVVKVTLQSGADYSVDGNASSAKVKILGL